MITSNHTGLSIIMADDDLDDQLMVKKAFRESGVNHVFTSVYNGEQLMDLLLKRGAYKSDSDKNPDLIIMDLNMRLLDGFGAIEQIRAHPLLKAIPIYVLTTSSDEEDHRRCLQLNVTAFYTKPESYAELKQLIQKICDTAGGQHP